MSDPGIQWPAIGFQRKLEVSTYANAEQFSVAHEKYIYMREGMVLVDSALRQWKVDRVTKLSQTGSLWYRILCSFYRLVPYRLAQRVTYLGEITLDEVKRLIIERIDGDPEAWWNDEVMAGEDGPPIEEEVYLETVRERIRHAKDMTAFFAMDEFMIDPGIPF